MTVILKHYFKVFTIKGKWQQNFFSSHLKETPKTTCTASVSDFSTDWEDFKQYLIVGRYLGGFSTGLSLLSRHQNIVNEVKIYCSGIVNRKCII